MLQLKCTSCGKTCKSDTERNLHSVRTGHQDFENKVRLTAASLCLPSMRAWQSNQSPVSEPAARLQAIDQACLSPSTSNDTFPRLQTNEADVLNTEEEMQAVSRQLEKEAAAERIDLRVDSETELVSSLSPVFHKSQACTPLQQAPGSQPSRLQRNLTCVCGTLGIADRLPILQPESCALDGHSESLLPQHELMLNQGGSVTF